MIRGLSELSCGSGRHTLAPAARGHHMVGVDISSTEAIGYARRAATDAALCMGNSFGYLDLPGVRRAASTSLNVSELHRQDWNRYLFL